MIAISSPVSTFLGMSKNYESQNVQGDPKNYYPEWNKCFQRTLENTIVNNVSEAAIMHN